MVWFEFPRIALAEQLQSKRSSREQNNWQGQGTNGRSERRMYISEIRIENFRCFGEGEDRFVLPLRLGLTALVGENDTGKTAVIDALRFALGTRD